MQFNPYYNMYYYLDNFNTLHIDSLQIAHITKNNTSKIDTVQDGHTVFFTTLHFKISSSQITARVKIDPGTQVSTTSLSHFKRSQNQHPQHPLLRH